MTGRTRYITGDPTRLLSDGSIYAGASVRSASAAAARSACAISRANARSAISTGRAIAQISSPRRAGRAGFGHEGSADHIAITGSLVNPALEAEFSPAQAWLESVSPPDRVTVIRQSRRLCARHARRHFAKTFGDYLRSDPGGESKSFPFCAGAARWR